MMRDSGVSDAGKAASAVAPGPMPAIKRACPCAKLAGDRRDQTAGRRICGSEAAGRRRAGSRSRRQRNPHAHASPGAGRARPVARDGLHLPQIAAFAAVGGPGRPFPEARQAADTVIEARLLSSFGRPNRQTRLEGAFPGQRAPLHCRASPLQWHRRLDRPSAFRFLGHAARSRHRASCLSICSGFGLGPCPFLSPLPCLRSGSCDSLAVLAWKGAYGRPAHCSATPLVGAKRRKPTTRKLGLSKAPIYSVKLSTPEKFKFFLTSDSGEKTRY